MPQSPSELFVIDHGGASAVGSDNPRVVLVHGSLDRGSSFARVTRRLSDLEVVSYDRRGYQRSRDVQPPATRLDDHIADLLTIVGDGPAVVIGHSYGGDVALGAAVASPATVRAVGAYEPPVPWATWWPRRAPSAITDEDPGNFAEAFFRRVAGDEAWEHLSEQRRNDRRADGPALVAELSDIRRASPPFDLALLSVPTVLGRGELSLWHHRRAVGELDDIISGAELVEFPGARHGVHLTHPDAFALFVRTVVRMSRRVPPPVVSARRHDAATNR